MPIPTASPYPSTVRPRNRMAPASKERTSSSSTFNLIFFIRPPFVRVEMNRAAKITIGRRGSGNQPNTRLPGVRGESAAAGVAAIFFLDAHSIHYHLYTTQLPLARRGILSRPPAASDARHPPSRDPISHQEESHAQGEAGRGAAGGGIVRDFRVSRSGHRRWPDADA